MHQKQLLFEDKKERMELEKCEGIDLDAQYLRKNKDVTSEQC